MSHRHILSIVGTIVLVLTCCSCSTKVATLQVLSPLPEHEICRVAVLPFANESKFNLGGLLFYRVFMAELVKTGHFDVVQEGDVQEIYEQIKLLAGDEPNIEQIRLLGSRLGAQAIITGIVMKMGERKERTGMNPSLAVNINILDARTGETLWSTYHSRAGADYRKVMHFGMVNTLTALAQHVSQEILTLWSKKGFNGCEK